MLVWIVNLIVCGLGYYQSQSPQFTPLAYLVLAGALLEARPIRVPGYGYFSLAVPFYLCASLTDSLGFSVVTGMAIAGFCLRVVLAGQETPWKRRLSEAGSDLLPVLSTALAVELARDSFSAGGLYLVTPEFYWVLAALSKNRNRRELAERRPIQWSRTHLGMLYPALGQTFGGVALAVGFSHGSMSFFSLLPFLPVLHQAAQGAANKIAHEDREKLAEELSEVERSLKQTSTRERSQAELLQLLEGLNRTLAGLKEPNEIAQVVVDKADELGGYSSVVLFQGGGAILPAVAHRSPFSELLKNLTLLELVEPAVETCWKRGKYVQVRPEHQRKLFVGELYGLCIPFKGFGVLYLGKHKPFARSELEVFSRLADLAAPALLKAGTLDQREQALAYHKTAHERLQDWVDRLAVLLEGSRAVATILEREQLLKRVEKLLGRLIRHDARVIVCLDPPIRRFLSDSDVPAATIDALLQQISEQQQKPLMLADTSRSNFGSLGPQFLSLLATPMLIEGRILGLIVLGAAEADHFERADLESLMILSYHLAAMFSNVKAHGEVKEALRLLKESQQQLAQSAKMAAVGQLAAGVAHELNSPLGAILFGLDISMELVESPPPKFQKRMQKIKDSAVKAQGIVSKLLFYSRQGNLANQAFDLETVVEDAVELLEHHFKLSAVRAELNLVGGTPVRGNQNELHQVVTNLLLNAKDALECVDKDQRRVVLATSSVESIARLTVTDTGPGIEPEALTKVFDPFFTTKEVGRGTGLGLSVCHQIVHQHGGNLKVESTPGRGARFILELPLRQDGPT